MADWAKQLLLESRPDVSFTTPHYASHAGIRAPKRLAKASRADA
jgi:hypothetical protein